MGMALLCWVPPSHPKFCSQSQFLLSWRAALWTFKIPLLNEVLCTTGVEWYAYVLVKLWFWTLVAADGCIFLLAVEKEQTLRRLAVKACSAVLPTLGNRHWHLLCGGTHLASSPSCGISSAGKKIPWRHSNPARTILLSCFPRCLLDILTSLFFWVG